jgi:hypothetical protein
VDMNKYDLFEVPLCVVYVGVWVGGCASYLCVVSVGVCVRARVSLSDTDPPPPPPHTHAISLSRSVSLSHMHMRIPKTKSSKETLKAQKKFQDSH